MKPKDWKDPSNNFKKKIITKNQSRAFDPGKTRNNDCSG